MGNHCVTRRRFIQHSALFSASLATLGLAGITGCSESAGDYAPGTFVVKENNHGKNLKIAAPNAPRPNIVVIFTDDQGYGDMGCYGSKSVDTPNMDRIAANGVRFTDFYACNAMCTPSRAGLLTGRYPQRVGLSQIIRPEPNFKSKMITKLGQTLGKLGIVDVGAAPELDGLSGDEITLPEALKTAGYRTGMVGKWHLGDFTSNPEFFPTRHGFDHYYGVPYANRMVPLPLYRNEERVIDHIEDQGRITALYTEGAVKFIEASKREPFFLYLAHTFPHEPIHASKAFKGKSNGGLYGDVIEELDWSVGEIMRCLKKNGLEENTLVMFTSDNGPVVNGSTGGLRGSKGLSFEGGFRVPFLAQWPGRIPGGSVCREPAMNIDIFPTALSLAGIQPPRDRAIDGKNIFGLMTGAKKTSPHEALFFYHHNELEGVRSGKWKYFRYVNSYQYPNPIDKPNTLMGKLAGKKAKSEAIQWPVLFDLELDPFERYNLIQTHPEIGDRLRGAMVRWEDEMARNPRGWL